MKRTHLKLKKSTVLPQCKKRRVSGIMEEKKRLRDDGREKRVR